MKKSKGRARRGSRRAVSSGEVARQTGQTLATHSVGALPLLNRILQRMKLEEFLQEYLPPEDGRTRIPTARVLLVLVRNLLVSREFQPDDGLECGICRGFITGCSWRHRRALNRQPKP